jgi:hypothetical protein
MAGFRMLIFSELILVADDFIVVQYSASTNGLPNCSQFDFQGNVVKSQSYVEKYVQFLCIVFPLSLDTEWSC